MATRCLWLLFLAISIPLANAQVATPPPSPAQSPIRISIKNEYSLGLNFGPLGAGERDGTDEANGVLEWKSLDTYEGSVTAEVDSRQRLAGMIGDCGPGHYKKSQKLDVVGRVVTGFNDRVQTVTINRATSTGNLSNEYLSLSFTPKSDIPLPTRSDNGDLIVECHTLIERPRGTPFLPLNDARWTQEGGGYIIALPTTGVLNYTDNTESGMGSALSPAFNVLKSLWTVQVERLP